MGEDARTNVIVVGAGASQEFGLPTGAELTKILKQNLDFQFDEFGYAKTSTGNRELRRAIELVSQRNGYDPQLLFEQCQIVSKNMPLAPSIDNFLDTHRHNDELVLVGKLAIANAIIQSENSCTLRVEETNLFNRLDFEAVMETWTSVFFKLIAAKRDFDSFLSALSNITFISFNYDRCIKQFFVNAAASYFTLQPMQLQAVLDALIVIHPYGSIGELKILGDRTNGFGMKAHPESILLGAERINTFTEGVSDRNLKFRINAAFEDAQVVIFLGFSFVDINMELLKPTNCKADRVLATAKGRSEDTKKRIAEDLSYNFVNFRDASKVEMFDGKCFELFFEFDHYLSSSQQA